MLVLTRKRSQMIQIGADVMITVVETGSRWVKIGIEAPDDVRVLRAELFGIPSPQHPLAALHFAWSIAWVISKEGLILTSRRSRFGVSMGWSAARTCFLTRAVTSLRTRSRHGSEKP